MSLKKLLGGKPCDIKLHSNLAYCPAFDLIDVFPATGGQPVRISRNRNGRVFACAGSGGMPCVQVRGKTDIRGPLAPLESTRGWVWIFSMVKDVTLLMDDEGDPLIFVTWYKTGRITVQTSDSRREIVIREK